MINFAPLRAKEKTLQELAVGLTKEALHDLTIEMIDAQCAVIGSATDADVLFVARDPEAEGEIGWSIGHVVVHTTATGEEAAMHALTLARGLPVEGRSRYETPWESVTTMAQLMQRMDESRRMRLALLDAWPDQPHLENSWQHPFFGTLNPISRGLSGLAHDDLHLGQLREIMRQAHSESRS